MKKITALLYLMFLTLHVQAQKAMTLQECIAYALEHNVELKQRAIDVDLRKQDVYESKNRFLPDVKAEVSEQVGHGNLATASGMMNSGASSKYSLSYTAASVTSTMPVYTGGFIKHQKKADEFSLESALHNLDAARKDLSIQISIQFLQVLYYKNLTEVSRQQCILSKDLLERAKARVEEGKSPISEQANAEAKLAEDEWKLAKDEGNVTLALVNLAQMLTLPSPESFDISEEGLVMPAQIPGDMNLQPSLDYYENCVENYPTIASAKAMVKEAESKVLVEKSKLKPTVSLRASLSTNYYYIFDKGVPSPTFSNQFFEQNPAEIIGVHVSVPIFNRGATRAAVNRSKLMVQNKQNNLELQRQELRNEIELAYYNAKVSIDNYYTASKARKAGEISFWFEKDKYEAGRSSLFDMNEANQKWLKAQQDELQAKYEYLIRKQILDFYSE